MAFSIQSHFCDPMQKDKLLLLFPDGVGIRNYLYADVFDDGSEQVLFHNFNSETVGYIKQQKNISDDIVIPDYRESATEKFLRELITLSRLYANFDKTNNQTLLYNWVWKRKSLAEKVFYKAIELLAPFCKSESKIVWLEKKYQYAIRQNAFYGKAKKILQQVQPKTVFCSHQRALKAATVFAAAADLNIPTATVIYSWDNLPKGRLALKADRYLVWSDYMKREMQQFFPEIPQEKIRITGTPQFEFYANRDNIINKATFFSRYGLDENKKTICFSGDDELTSPDDPKYLDDLADAIIQAGLQDQYQILMRRCPVDLSGRYDEVTQKHGTLIKQAPPLWNNPGVTGWAGVYPLFDDVQLLVSTAFYCDIVVNIGSTMAFDFAMFDKPCAFINYDQQHQKNENWSVNTIYKFHHFRSMPSPQAVVWINSKEEMAEKITAGIANGIHPDMHLWSQIVIGNHREASQNIRTALGVKPRAVLHEQ